MQVCESFFFWGPKNNILEVSLTKKKKAKKHESRKSPIPYYMYIYVYIKQLTVSIKYISCSNDTLLLYIKQLIIDKKNMCSNDTLFFIYKAIHYFNKKYM